jgi:hypothetical protein
MENNNDLNIELAKQILNKLDNLIEQDDQINKILERIEKRLDGISNKIEDTNLKNILRKNQKNIDEQKLERVITDVEIIKKIIIKN